MRSREANVRRACSAALLGLLGLMALVPAQAADSWKVEQKLLGEPREEFFAAKKSEDVSGIACATTSGFPRVCLMVDDETQGAQIAVLTEGKLVAGDFIRLSYNGFRGKWLELDAESVAYADGAFYVLGSHGRPRHQGGAKLAENDARATASRYLFRVTFDTRAVDPDGHLAGPVEIRVSTLLAKLIADQDKLKPALDRALEENGLTIEGVAVRGETLHVGMRGPVLDDGKAAVLSVPLATLFDSRQEPAQLAALDLGQRRGIRDLVPFDKGLLVLAGPVNDPKDDLVADGDYSVFWWDGEAALERLDDLPSFGAKVKPEGLLPLDRRGDKLRVLLVFDGPDEGQPREREIKAPPQ